MTGRRAVLLLLSGVLLLIGPAGQAAAAEPPDRARAIADRLARDPVYVDPARSTLLDASVQDRLRKRIGSSKVPIYVVVAPNRHEHTDPYEGDPEILLAFVHDRLRRDGVYVVADEDGDDLVAQEYGVERDAETATLLGDYGDPLRVSLPRFVDAVASGTAEQRYEEENGWNDEGPSGKTSGWPVLGILVVIMLVLAGFLTHRIRRLRRLP
ncbi:hypothetical protein [Streptomyces sp. NPDC020681]|uniref:hypothetical protein n=1 Tax=Streptomyces sp. NPDC020681 TaxID=3365083 RepID=UPI0037948FCA